MKSFFVTTSELSELDEKLAPVKRYAETVAATGILVHAFMDKWDMNDAAALIAKIRRNLPNAAIVGGGSRGEICDGRMINADYLLSVSVFSSTRVETFAFPFARGEEREACLAVRRDTDKLDGMKAAEIWATLKIIDEQTVFENLRFNDSSLPVFGAGVMGIKSEQRPSFVFTEKGVVESGIVIATYIGDDFHIQIEHVFGWKPLGLPMTATKSAYNRLPEVNGKPAYEVYRRYLRIKSDENFFAHTLGFPFITQDRGIDVLRIPHECTADGELLLTAQIAQGSKLRLTYGNFEEIFREVSACQKRIREFAPQSILLYDCITRKMFWKDGIDHEIAPFQKVSATSGCFCEGEIRSHENGLIVNHQCTLLAAAMREGEKIPLPDEDADATNESHFYIDASTVKRMATFVQTTTEELEEAYRRLSALNDELNVANTKLSYMAVTDELTQMLNRRAIEKFVGATLEAAATSDNPAAFIMIDIDYFKSVNDTYGHAVGDFVLKETADIIKSCISEDRGENAGRWGGEEFIVVLPNCNLDEAAAAAEKIRAAVAAHEFTVAGHRTASFGVTATDGGEDEKAVFIRVDDALYQSKKNGRNRVTVAS